MTCQYALVDELKQIRQKRILRDVLAHYVIEMYLSACRTCNPTIFPHSTNHIIVFWRSRRRCLRQCLNLVLLDWLRKEIFLRFYLLLRTIYCSVGTKVDIFISILWHQKQGTDAKMKVSYYGRGRSRDLFL